MIDRLFINIEHKYDHFSSTLVEKTLLKKRKQKDNESYLALQLCASWELKVFVTPEAVGWSPGKGKCSPAILKEPKRKFKYKRFYWNQLQLLKAICAKMIFSKLIFWWQRPQLGLAASVTQILSNSLQQLSNEPCLGRIKGWCTNIFTWSHSPDY